MENNEVKIIAPKVYHMTVYEWCFWLLNISEFLFLFHIFFLFIYAIIFVACELHNLCKNKETSWKSVLEIVWIFLFWMLKPWPCFKLWTGFMENWEKNFLNKSTESCTLPQGILHFLQLGIRLLFHAALQGNLVYEILRFLFFPENLAQSLLISLLICEMGYYSCKICMMTS